VADVGGKEHGDGTLKVGTAGGLATLEGRELRGKRSVNVLGQSPFGHLGARMSKR
jgi:hypothetical protein